MIVVFADDRTVTVLPDVVAVRTHCEAVDVEDGVYQFFDDKGRRLIPRMVVPVERTSLPFGIKLVGNGDFDLELAPTADDGAFDELLASAVDIEPNQWFATKSDLARHVSNRRSSN